LLRLHGNAQAPGKFATQVTEAWRSHAYDTFKSRQATGKQVEVSL
jgi:hypothetical protein